jgi:hypothetical protein
VLSNGPLQGIYHLVPTLFPDLQHEPVLGGYEGLEELYLTPQVDHLHIWIHFK